MICSNCGKELKDTAKFCSGCGHKVEDVVQPEVATSSVVTIYGYKEDYAINMAVKVFCNGEEIGKVEHDGKMEINVEGEADLKFKCSIRSATCRVKGGDTVVLSFDRVTGSLNALVTNADNLQTVVAENQEKDSKKATVITAIIVILFALKFIIRHFS